MQNEPFRPDARPRLASVEAPPDFAAPGQAGDEGGMPLLTYWRAIRHYKWSILGIALVAAVVGLVMAARAVPLYRADTRLLIKYNQSPVAGMQQFDPTPLFWAFFETQSDIIRSRAVAEKVVDKLHLDKTTPVPVQGPHETVQEQAKQALASPWRSMAHQWIGDWKRLLKQWLPSEFHSPPPRKPTAEDRRSAAVARVLGGLSVQGGKESEVLVLSYVSTDPVQAAQFVNAIAHAYIQFGLESRTSAVQQTTSFLGHGIEDLRNKLDQSEAKLREYQAREGLVDSRSRETFLATKIATLTSELIKAKAKRSEAEARYQQVKSLLAGKPSYDQIAAIVTNQSLQDAYHAYLDAGRKVSDLSDRYGNKHPKMIAARADLRDAKHALDNEVRKALDNVRKEFDLAAAQERDLQGLVDQQQSQERALSGKVAQQAQLERDVETNRNLYEAYLTRFKEAKVASDYNVANVRIIDPATPPAAPFAPNKRRIVMMASLVGIAIGVLLALLRHHLDNTFRSRKDVEEQLRLPVLGTLQRLGSKRWGRAAPERHSLVAPRSPFAEAINDIRTGVIFSRVDEPPKVILITSAVPGEGKTTLASNLAIAFAKRGRTLLVDADLRKPRLDKIAGVESENGLTNLVTGECQSGDAIVADPAVENLFIMPAGTLPPNPLEIVSSKRFAHELVRLRNSFDYVLIDGAPVLPVSDSVVVGHLVDAVILAVQAEKTTYETARDAVERLQSTRARIAGAVLQQFDRRRSPYGNRYVSGYNSYYGHAGYHGTGDKT